MYCSHFYSSSYLYTYLRSFFPMSRPPCVCSSRGTLFLFISFPHLQPSPLSLIYLSCFAPRSHWVFCSSVKGIRQLECGGYWGEQGCRKDEKVWLLRKDAVLKQPMITLVCLRFVWGKITDTHHQVWIALFMLFTPMYQTDLLFVKWRVQGQIRLGVEAGKFSS